MSITFNTRAIILRRENWSEVDKRVIFYSRDFGKIEALAKGAAKITSKLAGHLEPLREVDLMLAKGRSIDKVGQAVTITNYLKEARSFESYWYGGKASRLVELLTRPGQKDPALFEFLRRFLRIVKNDPPASRWGALWGAFCLKLLSILGYRPELEHCGRCRQDLPPAVNFFSPAENCLFCQSCFAPSRGQAALPVPADILKLLRFSLTQPLEEMMRLKISIDNLTSWRNLVKAMTAVHL